VKATPAAGSSLTTFAPGSPFVFTGLTNGTAYTFTVQAANSVGAGSASSPSNSVTPTASPPTGSPPTAAPGAVSAKPAELGEALVSYSTIADSANGGSPVTSYRATCSAAGQPSKSVDDTSAPFTAIAVAGLTNGVQYSCTVRALNANGAGPASSGDSVRVGAPTAPGSVTNAKGSTAGSIEVTWTGASTPASAPVTGHTIRCVSSSSTTTVNVGNVLTGTVTGLTSGITYSCKVAATNAHGTGAFKLPVSGAIPD
jgi:hypothetical protein